MMKRWLIPLIFCSALAFGQSGPNPDQNCSAWGAAAPASNLSCNNTGPFASGSQQFLPDIRGTITNQFEVLVVGTAPASLTVTVVGCMRGGTCSGTIGSSSGTASQIISPTSANLNIYDKYGVTVSWTGGDATTRFVVNRTGTVAKLGGGAGSGTVTNTGGALTANAVVLGAGGNDTKVVAGITTDGTSIINLASGGVYTINSDVGLSRTAPATLALGNGTAGNTGGTFSAQFINAINNLAGGTTATPLLFFSASIPNLGFANTLPLAWANTGNAQTGPKDIGISRSAVGVLAVGNGTNANRTGFVLSGNSVFVTSNFITSGVGTALESITGLAWTFPATALNYNFHCHLAYSQAVAAAAVAFGIKATTNNPTNIFATGIQQITVGPPATIVTGTLATLATQTATNIVTGTPGAIATNYTTDLNGTLELPASAVTINIMTSTATAADLVTVLRGSYCSLTP